MSPGRWPSREWQCLRDAQSRGSRQELHPKLLPLNGNNCLVEARREIFWEWVSDFFGSGHMLRMAIRHLCSPENQSCSAVLRLALQPSVLHVSDSAPCRLRRSALHATVDAGAQAHPSPSLYVLWLQSLATMRRVDTQRKLNYVEHPSFTGWACSNCNWVFVVPDNIQGETLDIMVGKFESLRDAAFAAHVCSEHQKGTVQ